MTNATLEKQSPPPTPTQPPEETVWKRYSAHNEAPLSTVGSLALHALFIGLLLLLGVVASMFGLNNRKQQPVELVQVVKGQGGIPGTPGTPGGPPGQEKNTTRPEEDVKKERQPREEFKDERVKLDAGQIASLPQAIRNDPDAEMYISRGHPNLEIFTRIGSKIRLPDPPSQGTGGSGTKDGAGQGGQGGTGGDGGDPNGKISRREKRMLRWTMVFDTSSGDNYVAQLRSLGAILGIPTTPQGGDYRLVRDLSRRPVRLLDEDFTALRRIQWTDSNPKSARDIANTLGLPYIPTHFIAFMPESLEQKLADLEKRYRGLDEDQIFETRFRIARTGVGYEPQVIFQTPK
jgi:hypothetical protein